MAEALAEGVGARDGVGDGKGLADSRVQLVLPADEVNPVGQLPLQLADDSAVTLPYLPAEQLVHCSAPASEYLPTGQACICVEPGGQDAPARHCTAATDSDWLEQAKPA